RRRYGSTGRGESESTDCDLHPTCGEPPYLPTAELRHYTHWMAALYSVQTHGQLEPFLHQEWLLTNGLGGFASSTVVGCNTRRYHGLLVAATLPPVGRVMVVNRIGESLRFDGDERLREFSVNQFAEGFHPHGEQYLRRFDL